MKNEKLIKLSVLAMATLGFSLSSCGSGSGSSFQSQSVQALIQPDGTAVLSDGTRVKMANKIFSLDSDRYLNTKVSVSGTQVFNDLGLVAVPSKPSGSAYLMSLSPNTGKLQIGASSHSTLQKLKS